MFLFFQRQISELPRPIAVKLCHTIGIWFYFIMQVQKFGVAPPKKIWGQKHAKFRWILYNLTLWSRISPERLKISKVGKLIDWEQFLPRSSKKVRWTLVHKWQRSRCDIEPTKMHLFGRLHFGPCWVLRPQIFTHARDWPSTASAHPSWNGGSPKKIVIVKM